MTVLELVTYLYGRVMILLSSVIKSKWLSSKIPVEALIRRSRDHMNRVNYIEERKLYRLIGALIRRGDDIDARSYKIYELIAQKYNWPYIKL